MLKKLIIALVGLSLSLSVFATSISVLKGDNFRDDLGYRKDKVTYTLEHFGLWELGTVFFYYDITEPTTDDGNQMNSKTRKTYSNQFFGGTSVTFSLSKITNKQVSYGIIKDVSIRLELENGSGTGTNTGTDTVSNNFQNYFYGLQYDVAIPGFDFFMFNTVLRDNPNDRGVGFQIGTAWQVTWDYGRWNKYKFTGFLATSPWNGDQDSDAHPFFAKNGRYLTSQPQFLYDLGYGLWNKPNRMEVGFEYAYFINRFQLKDKDEKCLQYMVKMSW